MPAIGSERPKKKARGKRTGEHTMTAIISKQQAATIAAFIRPQIRAYINANRKKYEAFLRAKAEKEQGEEVGASIKDGEEIAHYKS